MNALASPQIRSTSKSLFKTQSLRICRAKRCHQRKRYVQLNNKSTPVRSTRIVVSNAELSTTDYQSSSKAEYIRDDTAVPSGKVIGFLGGGQLGRMAALAAANLGVKVKVLDPTPKAPASVAADQIVGNFRNQSDIVNFAKQCDVLTVEIEHIDVTALREVADRLGVPVHPSPSTLELIQDKYRQKMHFKANGVPVSDFSEVNSFEELKNYCRKGLPVMLKSRRLAYDGRGNCVIGSEDEIEKAVSSLGGFDTQLYVEQWVNFKKELAVVVARSVNGEIRSYPVVETFHKESICFITETPAPIPPDVEERARQLAENVVGCLEGAGVYGVEMFMLDDGTVFLNEVAPRPHNSGHYTIDACYTSQFEQHIRAILGWPLGDTSLMVGSAIMLNILGEAEGAAGLERAQDLIQRALSIPGALIHWYEKSKVQPKRKIGHINLIGQSSDATRKNLKQLSHEASQMIHSTQDEGKKGSPLVSIIMGSGSDLPTMKAAAEVLESFGVEVEVTIVSAHRTPERMVEFAKTAHKRGVKVVIAGAGGAAHLPGMVAALTPLPVIGVPCVPKSSRLDGMDALLSIVQMPKGVPVATVAIGNAANAGLLAVRILATSDPELLKAMSDFQSEMKTSVIEKANVLESRGWKEQS